MIEGIVAVLMWSLVGWLLIFRRRRRERIITYAAVTIAIAMTLNIDLIYVRADAVLGGTNIATLIDDAALMAGLFFLGRGIMKAAEYQPVPARIALSRTALLVAVGGLVLTFFLIERGRTTTLFMRELGGQPAAAAYSMIDFGYCGIVVVSMALLAVGQLRTSKGLNPLPAVLVFVGAAYGLALCIVIYVMDIAHLVGDLKLISELSAVYEPLFLMTFILLCAGLAAQPTVRLFQQRIRRVQAERLRRQLEPLWLRATFLRPGLRTNATAEDPEARLHRTIVEIRDAAIDPRVSLALTSSERVALDRAEQHLLGNETIGLQPKITNVEEADT